MGLHIRALDESAGGLFIQKNHHSQERVRTKRPAGRSIKVRKVPAYERRVEVEVVTQFWQEYMY